MFNYTHATHKYIDIHLLSRSLSLSLSLCRCCKDLPYLFSNVFFICQTCIDVEEREALSSKWNGYSVCIVYSGALQHVAALTEIKCVNAKRCKAIDGDHIHSAISRSMHTYSAHMEAHRLALIFLLRHFDSFSVSPY